MLRSKDSSLFHCYRHLDLLLLPSVHNHVHRQDFFNQRTEKRLETTSFCFDKSSCRPKHSVFCLRVDRCGQCRTCFLKWNGQVDWIRTPRHLCFDYYKKFTGLVRLFRPLRRKAKTHFCNGLNNQEFVFWRETLRKRQNCCIKSIFFKVCLEGRL